MRVKAADAAIVRFKGAIENLNIELSAVGISAGLIGLRIAATAAQFSFLWMKGGALLAGMKALGGAAKVASVALWPLTAGTRALGRAVGVGAVSSRAAAKATATQAAATLTQRQAAFQSALAMQSLARQSKLAGLNAAGGAANVRQAGMALATAQGKMKAASAALAATSIGARTAASAFRILKFAAIGTGIGAILIGLAAAGTWIYNNWSGIKEMFAGIGEGMMSALKPVMPVVQPVIDGFGWLSDKVSGLLGPLELSNKEWRAIGVTIGETIGGAITSVIEKIKGLIGWFRDAAETIGGFFGNIGEP